MMGSRIRNIDQLYTLHGTIRAVLTHNLWVSALKTQIMGDQTLADVVAGIFTGVTSAVQAVKDGLSSAWDGIRSAGEYVTSTVLGAIIDGILETVKQMSIGIFQALFSIVGIPSSQYSISFNSSVIWIDYNGKSEMIILTREDLGLIIDAGDYNILSSNIITSDIVVETLGVGLNTALSMTAMWGILIGIISAYYFTIGSTSSAPELIAFTLLAMLPLIISTITIPFIEENIPSRTNQDKISERKIYVDLLTKYLVLLGANILVSAWLDGAPYKTAVIGQLLTNTLTVISRTDLYRFDLELLNDELIIPLLALIGGIAFEIGFNKQLDGNPVNELTERLVGTTIGVFLFLLGAGFGVIFNTFLKEYW